MKEPYLKYLLALAVTLIAGVGFAFDFLLRAKDYPELSMVMLAVIALVIAGLTVLYALIMSSMLGKNYNKSKAETPGDRFSKAWLMNVARAMAAGAVIIVFLGFSWILFSFSIENLGGSLRLLRDHLMSQMS